MKASSPPNERDAGCFLREHLGRDVGDVEYAGEGAWSRCFGFSDRGRDLVIRFGRFLDDFESDRRAASFRSEALPVPEFLELGEALGGYFAISSRVRGQPLESLDAEDWQAVLPSLFATLDAIREIDLSKTTGYGDWARAPFRSWRDFLIAVDADPPQSRTSGWRQKLIDSPDGDDLFCEGHALLQDLTDASPGPRAVVHGDLVNRNVFVEEGQLSGVFDWGCALYGDFLYDVAWIEFWTPWYEGAAELDIRGEATRHYQEIGLDVPDFDHRMRCCGLHIGLAHLAYNAHTGDGEALTAVAQRMTPLMSGT
jgi:hygromycin-B 4-O-kinase